MAFKIVYKRSVNQLEEGSDLKDFNAKKAQQTKVINEQAELVKKQSKMIDSLNERINKDLGILLQDARKDAELIRSLKVVEDEVANARIIEDSQTSSVDKSQAISKNDGHNRGGKLTVSYECLGRTALDRVIVDLRLWAKSRRDWMNVKNKIRKSKPG